MIKIDIPGFGTLRLDFLVSDFNGTLASDGKLIRGTASRLRAISSLLDIHVATADTFGSARQELGELKCTVHIVKGRKQDVQKQKLVEKLGSSHVVSIGNGMNDTRMLDVSKLSIAVIGCEGASAAALYAADICVRDVTEALDLLINTERMKATLRLS